MIVRYVETRYEKYQFWWMLYELDIVIHKTNNPKSVWSRGMIPPLGGGGPGFNPRYRPVLEVSNIIRLVYDIHWKFVNVTIVKRLLISIQYQINASTNSYSYVLMRYQCSSDVSSYVWPVKIRRYCTSITNKNDDM